MENLVIDLNNDSSNPYFIIRGRIFDILSNKRLLLTLKRLNYILKDDIIIVPFRSENQIQILQEIQQLFVKNDLLYQLSDETKIGIRNFDRENTLFEEFAEKAKSIRNDEFYKNPDLIENYKYFKTILNGSSKEFIPSSGAFFISHGFCSKLMQFCRSWCWKNLNSLWSIYI